MKIVKKTFCLKIYEFILAILICYLNLQHKNIYIKIYIY